MRDVSATNFGLVIAYMLPGFAVLCGLAGYSQTIADWLGSEKSYPPTVGGFLYVTVVSLGIGLFVSTLRWLIVDTIHWLTGVRASEWDFSQLHNKLVGFERIVEDQYRYYQFYANGLISLMFSYSCIRFDSKHSFPDWRIDFAFGFFVVVMFLGSRDTLKKYYQRVDAMLGE